MKSLAIKLISRVLNIFGYTLAIQRIPSQNVLKNQESLNLNVGASAYTIGGFLSLDYFSDHYFNDSLDFEKKYIQYDMRNDTLPFETDSVDNIFCSHVIEHVEYDAVERFILDAYRVLKPGGVLRITCPDIKYLYSVTMIDMDFFWERRKVIMKNENYNISDEVNNFDLFMITASTRHCRLSKRRHESVTEDQTDLYRLNYEELKVKLMQENTFDPKHPGDHISMWDIDTLQQLSQASGFSFFQESKPGGSLSKEMQGAAFDRVSPRLSLFCDFVK